MTLPRHYQPEHALALALANGTVTGHLRLPVRAVEVTVTVRSCPGVDERACEYVTAAPRRSVPTRVWPRNRRSGYHDCPAAISTFGSSGLVALLGRARWSGSHLSSCTLGNFKLEAAASLKLASPSHRDTVTVQVQWYHLKKRSYASASLRAPREWNRDAWGEWDRAGRVCPSSVRRVAHGNRSKPKSLNSVVFFVFFSIFLD